MPTIQKSSKRLQKNYVYDPEKFKAASKKANANDPEKFKEASKKAYANNPENFKKLQKRLIRKICTGVNKGLETIILSTKSIYVVRKGKNMYCVHPMNAK